MDDHQYVPPPNPGWMSHLFGEHPANIAMRDTMRKLEEVKGMLSESEQQLRDHQQKVERQEQIIAMYEQERLGQHVVVEQLRVEKDTLQEEKHALQQDNEARGERFVKEKQLLIQTVDKLQHTNAKLEEQSALEKRLLQQTIEKLQQTNEKLERSSGEQKRVCLHIIKGLERRHESLLERSASEERILQRTIESVEAESTIQMDTLQITIDKLELVAASTRRELEATRWHLEQCHQSLEEQALAQEGQRDELSRLQQCLSRTELNRAALVSARYIDAARIKTLTEQLEQRNRDQNDDAASDEQQQIIDTLKQSLARARHTIETHDMAVPTTTAEDNDNDNDGDNVEIEGEEEEEDEEADMVRNPGDDVYSLSDRDYYDCSSDAETAVEAGCSSPPVRPGTPYPSEAQISAAKGA